jgi:hypothetical protein
MQTVHSVPAVSLSTAPASQSSGEVLAIPVFEQDDLGDLGGLDKATGGEVSRARSGGEFRGKLYELFLTPAGRDGWQSSRVALVGAGARKDFSLERLRRVATTVGLAARQRRITRISLLHREDERIEPSLAAQVQFQRRILQNRGRGIRLD